MMVKKHKTIKIKHQENKTISFVLMIALALLVILGGLFLIFGGASNKVDYGTYNGFKFVQLGKNTWQTTVQMNNKLYDIPFYNNPHDINKINYNDNVTLHIMDLINTIRPKRRIIIAIHPDSGSIPVLAGVNIARITGKFYGANTSSALYLEDDEISDYANSTLPHVNCGDADFLTTIIKISVTENITSVDFLNQSTNCILVGADSKDNLLMAADELGYKLLGIMK